MQRNADLLMAYVPMSACSVAQVSDVMGLRKLGSIVSQQLNYLSVV